MKRFWATYSEFTMATPLGVALFLCIPLLVVTAAVVTGLDWLLQYAAQ